jgi:pimeloyl-ACP methyl ester carboxylesterase
MSQPEVVERMAILDAAHPRRLLQGLRHPGQLRKSWYFFFFGVPGVPEQVVRADNWRFLRRFLREAHPPYSSEDTDRYIEAWSQPGAATAMINYYRASVRESPKKAEAQIRPISTPTLVIWGQQDAFLGPGVRHPDRADVPGLDRVEEIPGASHWVHHDEPEKVNRLLIDFFAPGGSAERGGAP